MSLINKKICVVLSLIVVLSCNNNSLNLQIEKEIGFKNTIHKVINVHDKDSLVQFLSRLKDDVINKRQLENYFNDSLTVTCGSYELKTKNNIRKNNKYFISELQILKTMDIAKEINVQWFSADSFNYKNARFDIGVTNPNTDQFESGKLYVVNKNNKGQWRIAYAFCIGGEMRNNRY